MNTDKLAKVYLDNQPIDLDDARPKVEAILFASGKPKDANVQWLKSRFDPKGKTMKPEEVVDRTAEPTTPIYLTSMDAGKSVQGAHGSDPAKGGAAPEPKGGSGPDWKAREGKQDTTHGQEAVQQDPEREAPAQKKQPRAEDPEREAPAQKKQPRADEPDRDDAPAAGKHN